MTVDPEFNVGVVSDSLPVSCSVAPFCTVRADPQSAVFPPRSKTPEVTVQLEAACTLRAVVRVTFAFDLLNWIKVWMVPAF